MRLDNKDKLKTVAEWKSSESIQLNQGDNRKILLRGISDFFCSYCIPVRHHQNSNYYPVKLKTHSKDLPQPNDLLNDGGRLSQSLRSENEFNRFYTNSFSTKTIPI